MSEPLPLTPYICVHDAAGAIDFYVRAFEAREDYRLTGKDGRIGHAQLRIGTGLLMLADEFPEYGVQGPRALGGSPVALHLQVENADAVVERALAAGATVQRPLEDQFYGERSASLIDPFGHTWHIQSHIEDVSPDEMQRRMDTLPDAG